MKYSVIVIFGCVIVSHAMAGPIKDQVTSDPSSVSTLLQSGTYQEILSFIESAYAESIAENNDETTQYAYLVVLAQAPESMKIPLAIDFALDKSDVGLNVQGARAVRQSLLSGVTLISQVESDLINKFKSRLPTVTEKSQKAFDFGRLSAEALMLLGDDAGLDVYLTNDNSISNLKSKDGWEVDSDATAFAQLKADYEQKVSDPSNNNPEPDKIKVALYELCRLRRVAGTEITPVQPLVNLDQLKP
ncbi:MAG: hypothetical protein AAFY98_01810 [Verrucomicrobiota bacterium]